MIQHEGAVSNFPFALGSFADGIDASTRGDKAMMSAETLKMEVIAVIQPT